MISFRKGSIGFDKSLFSVDEIEFARGGVHVLMGRNGIGKSAFLNTISGMINPIKGSLDLDGKALYQYANKELSTKISYVSSSPSGVPFLSVNAYLMLGRNQFTNVLGRGNASDHKAVLEAKQIFEIEHLSSKFTNELSSGELHLCAIAKAYVQQTDYILLDEPTSHLDYANKIKVYQLLEKLAKTHNKGIIISTHDLDLAFKFPFNFYLIDSKHQRLRPIKDFKEVELEFNS